MFAWWGRTVYRYRFIVIGVTVALSLLGGVFGISLGKHVTQSGFYDEGSQSVKASVLGDKTYGRDRTSHIVATFTAPKSINDPAWQKKTVDELNAFKKDHPDQVVGWAGWLAAPTSTDPIIKGMASEDGKHTFVSIPLKGDDDDTILTNYKDIEPDLQKLNDGKVQLAGLEPIANALTGTIATDQKRMEVLALPLVAVVLFLVFGGVIAASLPAIVGGLSIAGSLGILRLITMFGPLSFFAQPVVSMMGFGIAIDYGLFVVSRFREEIAEGYDTEAAVRRTVMTAGRTVVFSAVLIAVSAASLFLLPQGFVKSLTYAVIISVSLAAVLSITLLPAILSILGSNVDALGVRTLFRIPFLASWTPSRVYLNWLADRLQKTKTREEVEAGFWGKLVNVVMKRPLIFAIPIVIGMIALVIPLHNLSFGGMSEKYLPPNNSVRLSQENFDKLFPGYRTNQLTLVIESDNHGKVTDQQVAEVRNAAASISGFTDTTWQERACPTIAGNPCVSGPNGSHPKDDSVRVIQNGLSNASDAAKKLAELRSITPPTGFDGTGRRRPGARAGQHPQLVRQGAADAGGAPVHDDAVDVPGVRIGGAADQGRRDERADAGLHAGHPDLDLRRRPLLQAAEFHADTADGRADRVGHRGRVRPGHRLRGVPGLAHGRGQSPRYVDGRGHPDRYGDHRPPDHRRCAGPGDGGRVVRVLRPGDDEIPGVRPDGSAAAGRDRCPDVLGAVGDEVARRRLLVGSALDEAPPESPGPRRDPPARRAQGPVGADPVQ